MKLAQVRAERGAVQERRTDLGRSIAARALWRGGMLAADYAAVRERVRARAPAGAHSGQMTELHSVAARGYTAHVLYDPVAGVYRAQAVGLVRDAIGAEGASVEKAAVRFWRAVERYLADCAAEGRAPEPPPSSSGILTTG